MRTNRLLLLLLCSIFSLNAYAWKQELAVGYGYGKEVDQDYDNQGLVITGKMYRFPNIDDTLVASIDGTIANIYASADEHKHTTTFAIALAMRAYFANPELHTIRPYIQASFGPAYLTSRQLGTREQGSNFAFQTTLELGTEIKNYDVNLKMMHFCNAGIVSPNEGINLTPVLSIGYLFA